MKHASGSIGSIVLMIVFVYGCSPDMIFIRSGPPAHAKAYGQQKKMVYHYYPDLEAYWDSDSNAYMVLRGRNWVALAALPQVPYVSYTYVVIETETPNPWLNHSSIKKKYPPHKPNKKSK